MRDVADANERCRNLRNQLHELQTSQAEAAIRPDPKYVSLARVYGEAMAQAQAGKGAERHAGKGESFEDQQIVQFGLWMESYDYNIGQACKKALESKRLSADAARAEILGAMNYLAAAIIVIDKMRDK
jgi:hypothetical protein